MKRGRKRNKKVKYNIKHIRKNFIYKLFIVIFIILFFIALVYFLFFVLEKIVGPEKETGLKGGLGTLKWDFDREEVVLEVLNYTVSLDNQTIDVNINWSSGNKSMNAIFVDFIGISRGCNYSKINDLVFGENKTYTINWSESICSEVDFSNVTDVDAYAQVNINLTQIALIPNITIYNDDSLTDVVDLDNYFSSLVNVSYSVVGDYSGRTGISINETTNKISFDPKLDRYGVYEFNLTAVSEDGEVLNITTNGDNMTFYVIFINATRIIVNHLPEFLSICDNLEWEVNKSYILDMETCWRDEDNESLTYKYENSSEKNLTISRSGNNLNLITTTNWNGSGYFYIYASDLKNETQGRVDFRVYKIINVTTNQTNVTANQTNVANNTPVIKTSSPSSTEINISSNESLDFSIEAENYESIKWYLDGVLVKSNVSSYTAEKLSEGEHEIKVEVKKGTSVISKIWSLFVSKAEKETPKKINAAWYFIILLVILGIIILIVIFFIVKNIMERKEENVPKPVIKELKPGIRVGYIPPSRPSGYSR